jgi:hypothetical protein
MVHNKQQSVGPELEGLPISELVNVIRHNMDSDLAKIAISRLCDNLRIEYPEYRFRRNFIVSELESRLREGILENRAVVIAFLENESKNRSLWKWRIHFAEIAGTGAVLSNMLSSIKSPVTGMWRAHKSLKEPLYLEPFGKGSRLWTCLSQVWEGSSVKLTYFGHTNDQLRHLVSVHVPIQFP